MLFLVLTFILYSIVGWTLDTAWRTLKKRRYTRGGFIKLPFSPIYGFGALLALAMGPMIETHPPWFQWLALSLILGAFEYVSGALILKTLHKRLWDYRPEPLDLSGYTTPYYAMVWGALALLVLHVVQPALEASCGTLPACAFLLIH